MKSVLIANRGEIAIRIARACADLGLRSVAAYSSDDEASLHRRSADDSVPLKGSGPRAYLDLDGVTEAAERAGCDAVHPGYGFLSENATFAARCRDAGLVVVGPEPAVLELFGDKARARAFAVEHGTPVPAGLPGGAELADVRAFQASLGEGAEIMIKAVAGGGGRGMRRVGIGEDPAMAFEACAREALAAFGRSDLYAEQIIAQARHVEVQVAGDALSAVVLGDRECSLQRRQQKLIEIAPAIDLPPSIRTDLHRWSVRLAEAAELAGLGTFEFLLGPDGQAVFIECNPRLQVEHTVTEAVTGLDLVHLQLRLAGGERLADLGLTQEPPSPRGHAVQLRVNLETLSADGSVRSGAGEVITRYEPPSGPGVRVDGYGYGGYRTNPTFDSLIAKLIVHSPAPKLSAVMQRAGRAAAEFRLEGPGSNLALLRAILERPEVTSGAADTQFVERELEALLARAAAFAPPPAATPEAETDRRAKVEAPPGTTAVPAPLRATVVSLDVSEGERVRPGQTVAVLEAMKMQHLVTAVRGGVLVRLAVAVGMTLDDGEAIAFIAADDQQQASEAEAAIDLDRIRPDLAEVWARQALTTDDARPDAVARRRRTGQRTARENLAHLFDGGAYKEFGALAIAAQRRRRSIDDLQRATPADGIVTGIGAINGDLFGEERGRCAALAYDFTVLAGTQGHFSHKKTDRILECAEHWKLPIVWYTEGGGGRPGDVDVGGLSASSLDTTSFTTFARLSGNAPRIAINSGRCFAGNAVFFGCADITIATRYSNIGLGGPAMIEGGGLGVFTPDEIGPSAVQWSNGVLDLLVEDEAEATEAARKLLGMFQGAVPAWTCADQRTLRHLIPENRVRAYDVRPVIETLADEDSFIELRRGYGPGMITGFLRVEGRPLGLIANDPRHLGGAIDSEGAEKGGRFLQLCDAFGVPVLSLCDTPGFMVGPDSEKTASVRRGSRLFVTAATLGVPLFAVVLRKGYGLGAQAMTGGDFSAAAFTVAWPTAEFGPMGLEGAVRLGYRKELDAETDPERQKALFDKLLGRMYETGKAISVAQVAEIDAVIDPAETRAWIVQGLKTCSAKPAAGRRFVDVW